MKTIQNISKMNSLAAEISGILKAITTQPKMVTHFGRRLLLDDRQIQVLDYARTIAQTIQHLGGHEIEMREVDAKREAESSAALTASPNSD